jgi:hypothetical protein
MSDNFNYLVGRWWDKENGQINFYTCGQQVQYGNMKDAESFLEYVQSKESSQGKEYKIFIVSELKK